MKLYQWVLAGVMGSLFFTVTPALAQDHGNGHGKGHEKHEDRDDDHDRDRDRHEYHYSHYEQEIRGWYAEREHHLPPGLGKKDHLPPGLEKQLVVRGTLPPGLQKKMYPVPVELERRLPPPPPECAHVFIGGNIVLVNRHTNIVVDIFHF